MGSHAPDPSTAQLLWIYRKKQEEGKLLAQGRPQAGSQLWWARCPSHPLARKTGTGPGEPAGMGARLQLLEGLTGFGLGGIPAALPWGVPAGIGVLGSSPAGPGGASKDTEGLALGVPLGCAG